MHNELDVTVDSFTCLFLCRYLTQEGIEECTENGRDGVEDIVKLALDVRYKEW